MPSGKRKKAAAMEPDELREIIVAFGASGKPMLAKLLPTTVRTIDRWLAGQRQIQPVEAARIRSLAPPGKPTNRREHL